jgi:protein-tyrosine phosphatase
VILEHFGVLIVCTGNMCRSPMAEIMWKARLAEQWGSDAAAITVTSAGVRAPSGTPMHPDAQRVLAESGLDGSAFRSRRLTLDMIDQADLVLTAARSHRNLIGEQRPAAYSRVYTLMEFADLAGAVRDIPLEEADHGGVPGPPDRLAALLAAVRAERGLRRPPDEIDVGDPIGQKLVVFRRCRDALAASTRHTIDALAPVSR